MKSRKLRLSLIGITAICVFGVCFFSIQKFSNKLPDGLKYDIKELPRITDFSTTFYGDYKYHFSEVSSASLKIDGVEEVISSKDPRLISLLNFLACGYSEKLTAKQQSYVHQDEIQKYISCAYPMLEITFDIGTDPANNALNRTPKIIVCGDSFLAFVDTSNPEWEQGDGMYAERFWPYSELLRGELLGDVYDPTQVIVSYEGWGCGYWIDLLEYSGFY